MVIDKLPFDKYELEPSPLTQYILERKSPHTCWQVLTLTCRPNVCNRSGIWDLFQEVSAVASAAEASRDLDRLEVQEQFLKCFSLNSR